MKTFVAYQGDGNRNHLLHTMNTKTEVKFAANDFRISMSISTPPLDSTTVFVFIVYNKWLRFPAPWYATNVFMIQMPLFNWYVFWLALKSFSENWWAMASALAIAEPAPCNALAIVADPGDREFLARQSRAQVYTTLKENTHGSKQSKQNKIE